MNSAKAQDDLKLPVSESGGQVHETRDGDIATVTISNPGKRNCLTVAMWPEFDTKRPFWVFSDRRPYWNQQLSRVALIFL